MTMYLYFKYLDTDLVLQLLRLEETGPVPLHGAAPHLLVSPPKLRGKQTRVLLLARVPQPRVA